MSRRPIRAAVLVIRLWHEETNEPTLRARILESEDVTSASTNATVAGTVDEICTIVKAWADRFARTGDVARR